MEETKVHLIFAKSKNNVIGNKNALPWHLPEDLAHFKRTTQGCPVIMGRKTWDSLPAASKPLPGRINIVVTHQSGWGAPGAVRASSIEEAVALCDGAPDAWVIGGEQVYAAAMDLATTAVVTEVDLTCEGDAFAPTFSENWQEVSRARCTSKTGLDFSLIVLKNSALEKQTT